MSHYLIEQIDAAPDVSVRTGTEVIGGGGDGRLEHLVLRERESGRSERVPAAALFVLIGAVPRTAGSPPRWRAIAGGSC